MQHTIRQSLYFCTIAEKYILATEGTFDDSTYMVFVKHEAVVVSAPSVAEAAVLCGKISEAKADLKAAVAGCQE